MEGLEVDKSLYDIGDSELKDLWGAAESFDSHMGEMTLNTDQDWATLLDSHAIILHDRMMTDAVQSPRIQSEHSYSLSVADDLPDSPLSLHHNIKIEDYGKDMESECFPAIPMTTVQSDFPAGVVIKQEPPSPPPSSPVPASPDAKTISALLGMASPPVSAITSLHPQSLLKQPTIVLATRPNSLTDCQDRQLVFPKVNIKLEPVVTTSGFTLPPTPPSSTSSDSEGSLSPIHSATQPASPPALILGTSLTSSSSSNKKGQTNSRTSASSSSSSNSGSSHGRGTTSTPLISSQLKGATGILVLTEEEKRTLLAEGYPIPQRLPLTKAEERSLKKIRRKIKNKISAQESRRKKKEYMDTLEKKVELLTSENSEYRKKLDALEGNNKTLISQLQRLQALVSDFPVRSTRNIAIQTTFVLSDDGSDMECNVDSIDITDLQSVDSR